MNNSEGMRRRTMKSTKDQKYPDITSWWNRNICTNADKLHGVLLLNWDWWGTEVGGQVPAVCLVTRERGRPRLAGIGAVRHNTAMQFFKTIKLVNQKLPKKFLKMR